MKNTKKSLFDRYLSNEDIRTRMYMFVWISQIIADILLLIGGCFLIFKILQHIGVI
ncbi:hypothetical protein MTLP_10910 [Candidatus Methanoliparum sp. LAM-1]|nr:hypothetical protein MTLP_10910 [Candidatus Methanoliparum sp. LAM-1]